MHVESADQYEKFWIEPARLAKSVGYSARELGEVEKIVVKNERIIKEKWDEYFGS